MRRLGLMRIAILALASVLVPISVAAQGDAVRVSGAAEATFPEGFAFNGVTLKGVQLGQGVLIGTDSSAVGQFHAVLVGTSLLGQAQEITVQGEVNAGRAGGDGSVTFSGTATLNMGDGSVPVLGVPFIVVTSAGHVELRLDSAPLPSATVTAGSVTIK